ncbi:acid phosphatase [Microthyrium microscopicum]|uniref:Acid phosphatase n=1 Tax=Microthyrium microscopicum TaxID=703497 RepID=A0A6A6UN82_9PEZI|nr:acid phosphatase [Microthyrium microscopicum]
MLPYDTLDQHSNYDVETYAGSEDASQYGAPLGLQPPTSAGLKRYSGGYDDAFSDVLSTFDPTMQGEPSQLESSSIDRDHKLLSFSTPSLSHPILDYTFRPTSISLSAQLHGMFFLAESAFPNPSESATQTELTCYRRNLFQVTGSLAIPRAMRYVMNDQGEQIPIVSQELTISATETVEGHAVKIICVPWKTPATSVPSSEDKTEKEPMSMPIDLSAGQEVDPDYATIPIAWKRLQFRIATANNGRRKELQQHFVVRLKVMATLANGNCVNICEIRSGAIIVRGRSPRNFQSRKDMPISGSGSFGRRREQVNRTSTGDSNVPQPKTERATPNNLEIPQMPFTFESGLSPDLVFDWKMPMNTTGAMTALPSAFAVQNTGAAPYAQSTPDLKHTPHTPRVPARQPINLSLVEDDSRAGTTTFITTSQPHRMTNSASPVANPAKRARIHRSQPRTPSFSLGPLTTSDESADTLYEYFPLGLDDWMPPVDAVYRPHVVHHTNLPADPKAIKNKSKRYFSEVHSV